MIVLSLFDGISCGRVALDRVGIKVDSYYASEIDKYAIQIAQKNYPDTIQLGDVTKWREWDIDWSSINLLIGGSPCQGFSFAGKQLAFDDPRSKLFFVYVDILNHIKGVNPDVKFLLENVKMKKEFLDVISEYLGVEPRLINSALLSAQNRQRYYWANWEFAQPEDRNIMLASIIEEEVDVKYRLSERMINSFKNKRGGFNGWFNTERLSNMDKSFTLTARYHKMGATDPYVKCGALRGRYLIADKRQDPKMKTTGLTTQRLEIRKDLKTNTLTTVQKDNIVVMPELFRRFTPLECERLQTLPEGYTEGVSDTQRYKALGNGWTVDVIAHIFKSLK